MQHPQLTLRHCTCVCENVHWIFSDVVCVLKLLKGQRQSHNQRERLKGTALHTAFQPARFRGSTARGVGHHIVQTWAENSPSVRGNVFSHLYNAAAASTSQGQRRCAVLCSLGGPVTKARAAAARAGNARPHAFQGASEVTTCGLVH